MTGVSVNILTHNRLDLLKRAVESVCSQSFGDWETIIVDDTGDGIANQYVERLGDKRIKCFPYYEMPTYGLAGARNFAIDKSVGKYIAILDDDDRFCNNQKLAQQFSFLENFPEYKVVGTNILVHTLDYSVKGRKCYPLTDEKIRKTMLVSNPFCHSATMFRKEDIISIGGYKAVEGAIENQEYYVWLDLGLKGKLANLPMQGVSCTAGHKKRNFEHSLKLYLNDFKTIYEYRDKYPNIFKAILKYSIVYPFNYAMGVLWES